MSNLYMPADRETIALEAAKMLLEIKAVHFYSDKPFIFTSGWASPVYIDCRKIISFPRLRSSLIDFAATTIVRDIGYESIDIVAGGETAGIPFAAWLADRLALKLRYVRKRPLGIGRNAQVEGGPVEGLRVLLMDDLTTDGGSKLNFARGLRAAGAVVEHVLTIFYHDAFPGADARLREAGLTLHALANWGDVLRAGAGKGLAPEDRAEIERFLADPVAWSTRHGGRASLAPRS